MGQELEGNKSGGTEYKVIHLYGEFINKDIHNLMPWQGSLGGDVYMLIGCPQKLTEG